tara:strand:+ start:292 stop:819 length:528 start_codon:yes stop_codon:yes gene_type:complete
MTNNNFSINTTAEERNTLLFLEIADVLEFRPEEYNQRTWGEFTPDFYNGGADDKFKVQFGYDVEGNAEDYNWIYADEECGSALCIAGHAAAFSGWFPTITRSHTDHPEVSWTVVHTAQHQKSSEPGHKYASDAAREALGINDAEAAWMFDSERNWTPDDLRRFAAGVNILPNDRQ